MPISPRFPGPFRKLVYLFLLPLLATGTVLAQNHSLRFDGTDDFVKMNLDGSVITAPNAEFTFETWFLTEESYGFPSPFVEDRPILRLTGNQTLISIVESNGAYRLVVFAGSSAAATISGATAETNEWRHLAVTYDGATVRAYIDCVHLAEITLGQGAVTNVTEGQLGFLPDPFFGPLYWNGRQDEFKVWRRALSADELCDGLVCGSDVDPADLIAYWPYNQGVAGGDNTGISEVDDVTGNGFNGFLTNFGLTGDDGNFVNGGAPIVTPDLSGVNLRIGRLPDLEAVNTSCSGDPLHFCLQLDGQVINDGPNISVVWEGFAGGSWSVLPTDIFSGVCFPVDPGILTTNCGTSDLGKELQAYRATVIVTDPVTGNSCEYRTDNRRLTICCPLSEAEVVIDPNTSLCEEGTYEVDVSLASPNPFVDPIGDETSVSWTRTITGQSPVDLAAQQLTFTDVVNTPVVNGPTEVCYAATVVVADCEDKLMTYESCLTIDPQPVCGRIEGFPIGAPNNLELIGQTPGRTTYEICPGRDATLTMSDPTDFRDCDPAWQFSFDEVTWTPFGTGNPQQNTNILPSTGWQGNTRIFYRIRCNPLSQSSECEPCFSNIVEVRLKEAPLPPVIDPVPEELCIGDFPFPVSASPPPPPGVTYRWIHNGTEIGTGTTVDVPSAGCFYVVAEDDCFRAETKPVCIEGCEVGVLILCPVAANGKEFTPCLFPGDQAIFNACGAVSTCGGPLGFEWFVNGDPVPGDGCQIMLTVPDGPFVVSVIATDSNGCRGGDLISISPC